MAYHDYSTPLSGEASAAAATAKQSAHQHLINTAVLVTQTRHCTPPASVASPSSASRAVATAAATTGGTPECSVHHAWRESIEGCIFDSTSLTIDVCISPGTSTLGPCCQTVSCDMLHESNEQTSPDSCSTSSSKDNASILVERWVLELTKSARNDTKERLARLPNLHQAIRSTLLFSQLRSWLTLAEGKWPVSIKYNLMNPSTVHLGRGFPTQLSTSSAGSNGSNTAVKPPIVNTFPPACVDGEHTLRVRCTSLPYGSDIPFASPRLLMLVAERRQMVCGRSAKSDAPSSAAVGALDKHKRRSKLLKDLAHSSNACQLVQPEPCTLCGAFACVQGAAGAATKIKQHRKSQPAIFKPSSPAAAMDALSPTSVPTAATNTLPSFAPASIHTPQLRAPVQPMRVKSPPRPISPAVQCRSEPQFSPSQSCEAMPPTSPSLSVSPAEDSPPYRQNSAPLPYGTTTPATTSLSGSPSSMLPSWSSLSSSLQRPHSVSACSTRGLSSSSLLKNQSTSRFMTRRSLQADHVHVGSPYPQMPTHPPSGPRTKRLASWSGPLSTSPLLGTFEESMFGGRLTPTSSVEGYKLELRCRCTKCGVSTSTMKLDLQTNFYETESGAPSPYLGVVKAPSESFHLSRKGSLQAALVRPTGTILHVFVLPYDLSHLELGQTTFIRQRVVSSPLGEGAKPILLYAIQFSIRRSCTGSLHLQRNVLVVFSPLPPDVYDVTSSPCKLVTDTRGPHIPTLTAVKLSQPSELQHVETRAEDVAAATSADAVSSIATPAVTTTSTTPGTTLKISRSSIHERPQISMPVTKNGSQSTTAASAGPLLSPEEVIRRKQEAAAEVAAAVQTRSATPSSPVYVQM